MKSTPFSRAPRALVSRRKFIFLSTAATAAGALAARGASTRPGQSPNEKLNIAVIGAGGKGASDSAGVSSENIVALCDIDQTTLLQAARRYPRARLYRDYREMLDKQKDIDAVTVSTPDHHHGPAAYFAMQLGKHAYVQKPLTHSIYEARQLAAAARHHKAATQMGNQGHSAEGNRQLCEMIWSGAIGAVREVHCWSDRPLWPQGIDRPAEVMPVPDSVSWDLFLGPAPERPYHPAYHPFKWRGWWDFGCGALGDMGCHILDGPVWSLKLAHPTSVEIVDVSGHHAETGPKWSILRYHFPAREGMPAVALTWYDGGKLPPIPEEWDPAKKFPGNGALLVGDKGKIFTGTYGENPSLLPATRMAEYARPEKVIPRVSGHFSEWIEACKGGQPASSNFEVSAPFTEVVLLGNLALRLGKTIEWDGAHMRVKNSPDAGALVKPAFRTGWKV